MSISEILSPFLDVGTIFVTDSTPVSQQKSRKAHYSGVLDLLPCSRLIPVFFQEGDNIQLAFEEKKGAEMPPACDRFLGMITQTTTASALSLFPRFDLPLSQEMPLWLGVAQPEACLSSLKAKRLLTRRVPIAKAPLFPPFFRLISVFFQDRFKTTTHDLSQFDLLLSEKMPLWLRVAQPEACLSSPGVKRLLTKRVPIVKSPLFLSFSHLISVFFQGRFQTITQTTTHNLSLEEKKGVETPLVGDRFRTIAETTTYALSLFSLFDLSLSEEMHLWLRVTRPETSLPSPGAKRLLTKGVPIMKSQPLMRTTGVSHLVPVFLAFFPPFPVFSRLLPAFFPLFSAFFPSCSRLFPASFPREDATQTSGSEEMMPIPRIMTKPSARQGGVSTWEQE